MVKPLIVKFGTDTSQAESGIARLASVVASAMGSVNRDALAAHQAFGYSLGGIADKSMTAAKAIGTLAAAHKIAVGAFLTYTAAAAAGAAELAKFQDIAERAASSNVGTTYFQAFTVGAERLGAKLKEVQNDLAALERATRDRHSGESLTGRSNKAIGRFEEAFLDVPVSQTSPALDMLRNAATAEERLRAITRGLSDLEVQSRQLLAIDIARDLGLKDLADLVERGKTSFVAFAWQVRELEATGLRDGSLVSPELINRAQALRERFGEVTTQLANNMRPVLDECARLALDIGNGAAWTAEQFNKVVGVVGRIVGLLREGVNLVGRIGRSDVGTHVLATDRMAGLRGEIQDTQRQLDAMPRPRVTTHGAAGGGGFGSDEAGRYTQFEGTGSSGGFGTALDPMAAHRETLQARIVQMRGELESLSQMAAEERRGRALGNLPPPSHAPIIPTDRSATRASPLDVGRSAGGSSSDDTDKRLEAVNKFIENQQKANELLQAELATIGKTTAERERALNIVKAEAEARRHGGELTAAERERIAALAEAHGRLRDAVKETEASQRALADAFQYAGDKIADLAFRGGKLQDVFRGIAAEMLRASLTGQGFFAKLLGTAPAAGAPAGTVGGLFGLLGSMFGGGGGLLGGLTGTAILHEGGVVGAGGRPGLAPVGLWAGAPRLHRGGSLKPDEVPIIGQLGEEMLTKNQRIAAGRVMDFASQAASWGSERPNVTVRNSYSFNGVTAADRQWITSEMDARDQANAERIIPTVQDAGRRGVDIDPYGDR